MKPLYGFGHTQEDELTEAAALDLPGGDLLCITSAGEMPLNLLALGADRVVSVDIDPAQNHLARLKLAAVLGLEREEAIAFLGYMPMSEIERMECLDATLDYMPDASAEFWRAHEHRIKDGPIWMGKFEHYIHLALEMTGPVVSKPFRRMAQAQTMEEQRAIFADALDTPAIHGIFRLVFSPTLYGGRGLEQQALQHHDESAKPLGERFFDNVRALCENTPARSNPYLQIFTLGEVLSPDVVPTYLTTEGFQTVRDRAGDLEFVDGDVLDVMRDSDPGAFNLFHLSNVTDWMPYDDFATLLDLIVERCRRPARIIWRAIHAGVEIPEHLDDVIEVDFEWGEELRAKDRFPMYAVMPAVVR